MKTCSGPQSFKTGNANKIINATPVQHPPKFKFIFEKTTRATVQNAPTSRYSCKNEKYKADIYFANFEWVVTLNLINFRLILFIHITQSGCTYVISNMMGINGSHVFFSSYIYVYANELYYGTITILHLTNEQTSRLYN